MASGDGSPEAMIVFSSRMAQNTCLSSEDEDIQNSASLGVLKPFMLKYRGFSTTSRLPVWITCCKQVIFLNHPDIP